MTNTMPFLFLMSDYRIQTCIWRRHSILGVTPDLATMEKSLVPECR